MFNNKHVPAQANERPFQRSRNVGDERVGMDGSLASPGVDAQGSS